MDVVQCTVINPSPGLILLGDWCHIVGFRVGLCYWLVGHSAVTVNRSVLVSRSPCHWVHTYPISDTSWQICSWAHWARMDWLEKNLIYVHRAGHIFHLIVKILLTELLFMNSHIFMPYDHSERSIHTSLSSIFQLCCFRQTHSSP